MYKLKFQKNQKHRLKLVTEDKIVLDYIRKQFSTENPKYRFSPHSEAIISPISLLHTFPDGLALDIIKSVKAKFGNNIEIDISEVKHIIQPISFSPDKILPLGNPKYEYRDYQEDAIKIGLRYGRGLFHYATASGKSAIMWGLIKNIWHNQGFKSRVLIITSGTQLVQQLYKDFLDYGCDINDITKFTSNTDYDISKNIIICNRQWINNRLTELDNIKIDVLLIDEVQQVASKNNIHSIIKKMDTYVRFGLSGTIPKEEEKEKYWNVVGLCGMILSEKRSAELQQEGYIAKSKFLCIKFVHSEPQPKPEEEIEDKFLLAKAMYPLELEYIENNKFTNFIICKTIFNLKNNSIILFDHIEHGHILHKILSDELNKDGSKEIFYIDGSVDVEYREQVRAKLENINNAILVANTKCFSTGINIKNIHNIGFAFGSGKSATKIIQSIGRGLRNHENKDNLLLIDFSHNYMYSVKHFIKRLDLYKKNYDISEMKSYSICVKNDIILI